MSGSILGSPGVGKVPFKWKEGSAVWYFLVA